MRLRHSSNKLSRYNTFARATIAQAVAAGQKYKTYIDIVNRVHVQNSIGKQAIFYRVIFLKHKGGAHKATPKRHRFHILKISTAIVAASAVFINIAPTEETHSGWKAQTTATTASLIALQESAPQIVTKTLPAFVVGAPYYQQLQATASSPVTWSLQDEEDVPNGVLPDGIELTADGVLSGTPTSLYPSNLSQNVTFVASSDGGDAVATLALSIYSTPAASGTLSINATLNKAFSYKLTATGYPVPTWTKVSGTLPTGLTLASNGTLSGTATVEGDYTFTVRATNSAGTKDVVVSLSVISAPSITTSSLENGYVGARYQVNIEPSDDPSITYTISAGALPGGLTLQSSGLLVGTVTTSGVFNFTVKATNAAGTSTKALSIIVGTPAITLASPQRLYVGVTRTIPVTIANFFADRATITASGTLPAGTTFNGVALTGAATATTSRTVTFTAKGDGVSTATKAVQFTSTGITNTTLTGSYPIGGTTAVTLTKGTPYNYVFKTAATTSGATFGRSGTAPAGMTAVTNTTGTNLRVYGIPTTAGTYNLIFIQRTTIATAQYRVTFTVK